MMPFRREPAPPFWTEKEQEWLDKVLKSREEAKKAANPLDREHQSRTLRQHFRESARIAGRGLCTYCDGKLKEQSREEIDHFLPRFEFPELALCWTNLYPACQVCNQDNKGTRWWCDLLRPDVDLSDEDSLSAFRRLFWFEPESGRLLPAEGLSRFMKLRVRMTLRIFGLNTLERRLGRKAMWQDLKNAMKPPCDFTTLADRIENGPYRFIALEIKDLYAVPAEALQTQLATAVQ